jgi:predicted metalloprotease
VVLGALIRAAATRVRRRGSRDRLGLKTIDPLIRAIRSRGTDPKRFVFRGIEAGVTAHAVVLRSVDG